MKISVDVTPHEGGIVEINGSTQSSYPAYRTFMEDTVIQLEAQPRDGYDFIGWSGDLSGSENPVTIEMDSAKNVTANFSNIMHPLTIQVTIQVNGSGSTNPTTGTYSYGKETEIDIIATPDSGWQFNSWSGGAADPTSPETTILIDSDKSITANFSQIMHSLTIQLNGSGSTTPVTGTYSYAEGTEISITATPDSGWQFDGWSGEVSNTDSATTTVVMDTGKSIAANFSQIMHTLTLTANGNGLITPTIGAYSHAEGTEVSITATPDSGWRFASWSGEVADPESATTTIIMDSDKSITANFSQTKPYKVIIGIIAGAVGAGLATFFATRRQKSKPETTA